MTSDVEIVERRKRRLLGWLKKSGQTANTPHPTSDLVRQKESRYLANKSKPPALKLVVLIRSKIFFTIQHSFFLLLL